MDIHISGFLEQLIFPPGGFIFLSGLGLVLIHRFQRTGIYMTASGLGLLFLASLPASAFLLMSWLEPDPTTALSTQQITQNIMQTGEPPQAIVILGAGRRLQAPEYGGDIPNAFALERIRYGVWLARRTLLPVLVTGGLGDEDSPSEAAIMKKVIESEYALAVRWRETQSHTTYENAKYTAEILKAEGIESIYLVTHAFHMKRSAACFEKFGFKVLPAPTAFNSNSRHGVELQGFLPSAKALNHTTEALHEWVGMLWYGLRYGI